MPKKIKIIAGEIERIAILNDSPMAQVLWKSLPLESSVNRWGDEIYFSTSLKEAGGEKREVVDKGDIAFWSPGSALCIFFGLTPASRGEEIRPASEVILVGKVEGDLEEFKKVEDGKRIRIEEA
ncbi:hypothetical protein E3J84_05085 [Candidatus Aerophobetes bacterium]|uniref:Cyclophilin TM1367-like domain-containing protein n=1 Tax=Aerophobetes bacterium TaxID=2030807 RepID=A0A523RV48_UNCAE|nr:MAG: hypothetical protein E3J84_05085 [Candidatus Aerophobetes bacterium]